MNEGLIELHNSVVKPQDHVYNLGDVSFGKSAETAAVLRRLNGHLHFISGNHDEVIHDNADLKKMFASARDYHEFYYNKTKFVLSHFPFQVWHRMHGGSIHVHGHCHNTLPQSMGKRFDVGVDSEQITGKAEHRPFHIDEIMAAAAKVEIVVSDHHRPQPTTP